MTPATCEYCVPGSDETETLRLHAITRIPAATYLVGGFRYTSLGDAVAQARRIARPAATA